MSRGRDLWDPQQSFERVALEDVQVEIPVGVRADERGPGRSQRVHASIELFRHRGALQDPSLAACLDYDRLAEHVLGSWTPDRQHTGLLEVLAEELIELALTDPRVEACRVTVRKPDIYHGRATPAVEVYRLRDG